jgi:hypothetical protein
MFEIKEYLDKMTRISYILIKGPCTSYNPLIKLDVYNKLAL